MQIRPGLLIVLLTAMAAAACEGDTNTADRYSPPATTAALAAHDGNAVALNNLAVSHLARGETTAAAPLLRQALASPALKPQHRLRAQRNLALALAIEGRFDEADALAGAEMPRELFHADAAAIRRFLGLTDAPPSLPAPEPPHLANSWRPVDDPSAP